MIAAQLPSSRIEAMTASGLWHNETILDHLDCQLSERPGATAIVNYTSQHGRVALTYAELSTNADRIARNLFKLGIRRGDVVSFQLPNWWQFTAIHLACMRIGAVSNPLMPIFRERELRFMLTLAESKILIIPRMFRHHDFPAMVTSLRADLPALQAVFVVDGAEDASSFERGLLVDPGPLDLKGLGAAPNDVMEILYTSGTTGEPKGVMHTSNTLLSNVHPYTRRLGLGQADVVLMSSPLAHQTGFVYGMMMPIVLGATAILQELWNPDSAAKIIEQERVTYTMASTTFVSDLLNVAADNAGRFATLRIFHSAGAPIPRVIVRRVREELGAHLLSGWGMTENGAVTTTMPEDKPEKVFETDGCAIPGMELRVVDAEGRPVDPGVEGRLLVRSCSNFVGYLKRPDFFDTDTNGWFDTGDLARLDTEGYVRISGRLKDIIIRGGENIPVVEIEGLLFRHPEIQDIAIVAMPDARLGEKACAFVVPAPGTSPKLDTLVEFLHQFNVARQYMPERLELLPSFPKTASGKIQKAVLREMARRFATE